MAKRLRMKGWPKAVHQACRGQLARYDQASGLIERLLSFGTKRQNLGKVVIVVFTGYGTDLAEHARVVSEEHSNARRRPAPIFVFGPDNLCAFAAAERTLDAVSYRTHIVRQDREEKITRRVVADASLDTKSTPGQATVAARRIEERGFQTALLVTAAYHLPRAYMTLLKALIKRGIHEDVTIVPKPYWLPIAWKDEDPKLIDSKSWDVAFREELSKIIRHQAGGDVASWQELEECLERLRRRGADLHRRLR